MKRYTILILAALAFAGCSSEAPNIVEPGPQDVLVTFCQPCVPDQNVFIELTDARWRFARLLYVDYEGLHCAASQAIPSGATVIRALYGWDEVERWWMASEGGGFE